MDATDFLFKGLLLGFSIAAPVGPIGVLCIRRTLANGMSHGIISGLGAATADAVYGLISAFGVTAVGVFLTDHSQWLRLIGGLFLLYLGFKTFRSAPETKAATAKSGDHLTAFASTLFLTLTNPMTVLSFAAIFAGLGAGSAGTGWTSAAFIVLGVFSGSLLWWVLLAGFVGHLREGFDTARLLWVNRISGAVICTFGFISLAGILP